MFSGAVGQIYCRHPLGLTPVRQGGAPVSASRTIVAVAVHTSCSTQNACEFVLVSRAQSHHANTLVGLLALTRFFTSVRLSDPGLGSHGPLGPTATLAVLPGPLASSSQLFARVLLRRFLVDPLDALALLKRTLAALRDTCRFLPLRARGRPKPRRPHGTPPFQHVCTSPPRSCASPPSLPSARGSTCPQDSAPSRVLLFSQGSHRHPSSG